MNRLRDLIKRAARVPEYADALQRLGVEKTVRRALRPDVRRGLLDLNLRYLPAGLLKDLQGVVDVGGNEGSWTAAVLSMATPAQVVIVEPDPICASRLRDRFANKPNLRVEEAAASDGSHEVLSLNLTSENWANSLMQPRTTEMDGLYGHGYQVASTVEVAARTLDDLTAHMGQIDLMKIDVQGAEAAVIAGAACALGRTRCVQLEVGFYSHYEGDTLFPQLFDLLIGHGFHLAAMSPAAVLRGRAMWADAFFEKP